jgi:crotonobetainyl-CoA:carnitine CoA-transferase CaiB-like acyl-CoA transferase
MLTTMLNTMAHVLSDDMFEYEGRGPAPIVDPGIHGFGPLYRLYAASDGWLFLAAPTQKEWDRLALVIGGDWNLAARFSSSQARTEQADELAAVLETVFASRTGTEWEHDLTAVDVACVVVADGPPESTIMEGGGGLARTGDLLVDLEHPVIGEYPRMKPLVGFSRSAPVTHGAPLLGADTDVVLRELGYQDDQIRDLHDRGIAVSS